MRAVKIIFWTAIALCGAFAYAVITRLVRPSEQVNALWLVVAAACTYLLAYRFYGAFLAAKVFALDDRRPTPAVTHADGRDFDATNKWVLFGHHFAAIAGAGPLIGPVLAAQFGYLPGALWILIGAVFAGAVQDFVVLVASVRHDGCSLAEIAKKEVGPVAGVSASIAVLFIITVALAGLGLDVVNALADSPWGTFTIAQHDPDRAVHGLLPLPFPARESRRDDRDRRAAAARRGHRRARDRRVAAGGLVHALAQQAGRWRWRSTASPRRCCRSGCCSARAIT